MSQTSTLKGQCIAEFLGTGLLIFFGVGCVAALKVAGASFGQWEISVIWGLGVAMAIYLTAGVSGGPDRALCHYPREHYLYWAREFPEQAELFVAPAFGENLSTDGLTESNVYMGDIFRWGEALIQVSQPRSPCSSSLPVSSGGPTAAWWRTSERAASWPANRRSAGGRSSCRPDRGCALPYAMDQRLQMHQFSHRYRHNEPAHPYCVLLKALHHHAHRHRF